MKCVKPGNTVLIPLVIEDESLRPCKGLPFRPAFSVVVKCFLLSGIEPSDVQ